MKIIDELIGELTNKDNGLTDILIKTKVLAFKLKNTKLISWIDNELNGYPNDNLPDYRVLQCQVLGTISNGFQRATNYPIPLSGLKKEEVDALKTIRLTQSISTLDEFIYNKDAHKLIMNIQPETYGYLSQSFGEDFFIEFAKREIDKSQIIQILTTVRTKLLDFLLQLNEELGETDNIKPLTEGKAREKVSSLFNSSVFGNNTTIIVGDYNTQNVTNITKGDFSTIETVLIQSGVSPDDVNELKSIIDSDNKSDGKKEFGTKVKNWISKMLSKAMDNSWKIGLGAAGQLLADAISKYYGWT